jgi:hypothetical protein
MHRMTTLLGSAAAVATALAMGTAGSAQADASGIATWGTQAVGSYSIPAGSVSHYISGEDLHVNYESADFQALFSCVSSWRIDFRYLADPSSTVYKTLTGPTHSGCDRQGTRQIGAANLRAGLACARFFAHGKLLAEQCHQIYVD